MLKDIINIILKMHIPCTPLCNLHYNIEYVLQFTMEHIMCVYICYALFTLDSITCIAKKLTVF